jgi:hypothetical protein
VKPITVTSWNKKFIYSSHHLKDNVEIFGNWNNWSEGKKMEATGNIGFEAVIPLGKGTYEYKYLVNGQWVTDHKKPANYNGNHTLIINL